MGFGLTHIIKIIVRSFGSSKNTKLEDGPYKPGGHFVGHRQTE